MMEKQSKSPVLYKKISMAVAQKQANELMKFAKANNLSVDIAGKDYMMVEGWQFLGTLNGLTDIVQYCDPIDGKEKEVKYKAMVEVINQNGTVISRGFAYASNLERKKTGFEEYAVASMAQTRAIGKAYRNFLAWIVKMAGYEATPFEEIDRDKMESNLGKAKQNIVKAFRESGITDSRDMIATIQNATGKDLVETIEDADKVLSFIERGDS